MRNMRIWLAKELGIKLLHRWVLMALAYGHGFILAVCCGGTRGTRVNIVARPCIHYRLTAAGNAAARAAHHLYEMICLFARAYGVEQLCGVCRTVNYGNFYIRAVHVYGGLLYALKPAHVRIFKPRHILPRQHVHNRAQRRLHNAARHAEYNARARGFAQHIVELLLRQVHKVQPRLAYHAGKLPRGKVRVHVAIAVPPELRPRYFKFLSRAGHYAYNVNIARVKVVLLGKVCLCYRALHLVRTFAG